MNIMSYFYQYQQQPLLVLLLLLLLSLLQKTTSQCTRDASTCSAENICKGFETETIHAIKLEKIGSDDYRATFSFGSST